MSVRTNPSKAVPALLSRLTKAIDIHQAPSSADAFDMYNNIRSDIDKLKNQFPEFMKLEKELFDQFVELNCCHHKIERSDFSSVLDELKRTNALLCNLASESGNVNTDPNPGSNTGENQNGFKELSPLQEKIMKNLDDNGIVKSLRVSYDFLESVELRLCLLFLAIFPENAVLKKRLLIYWWIGEGLVPNEEKGEEIFGKLLELGMIMPHRIDNRPAVNKCKLHPWIRYMLVSVATKEKLLQFDEQGVPRFDPDNSRRVCLIGDDDSPNLISETGSETETESLRTIFNVSTHSLSLDYKRLAGSKFAVLQLGRWQVYAPSHHIEVQDESFLEGLKTQKHLKYLSLRGISRITTLPDAIRELVSLQILDLKACHNIETLPDAVAALRKLTHLDVSECYLLESMPKGLHKLTSLQVLKGFLIGNLDKTPVRIRHLQKLKHLERLSIHIGSEAVDLEKEFEQLEHLKEVKCLKISWGVLKEDLIKAVSFPPSLKKLDLEGLPYGEMPDWLQPSQLSRLEKLYIKGGNLSKLKGGGWNVRILILKYTDELETDEQEVRQLFPLLQYVKKVNKTSGTSSGKEFEWPPSLK